MVWSLCDAKALPAVQLYRVLFAGYLEEVEVADDQEDLADFLTSEGVLSRPDPSLLKYHAVSPLIDGLLRERVIPSQFPIVPTARLDTERLH
jgi:hypothetical protein